MKGEEIPSKEERVEFLQENYDLTRKNALALYLAEFGYSTSGIAHHLDVTQGTAKKYLRRLENRIGEGVTETLPKSRRHATFPNDTVYDDEPQIMSDVIEPLPKARKEFEELEVVTKLG
jgi:hypothetical protein